LLAQLLQTDELQHHSTSTVMVVWLQAVDITGI
jgi:hypothetical protein